LGTGQRSHGNIAATLRSGLAQHLEITPPEQHPAIRARVAALRKQGEALAYLKEVAALVQSARAQAGVRRSARVRLHTRPRREGSAPR